MNLSVLIERFPGGTSLTFFSAFATITEDSSIEMSLGISRTTLNELWSTLGMNSNPMNPSGKRAQMSTVSARTIAPTQRLWPSDHLSMPEIQSLKAVTCRSNQAISFPQTFFSSGVSTFPNREVSSGTRVSAPRRLKRMAKTITPQNWRRLSDTSDLVRAIGRKTMSRTMVPGLPVYPLSSIATLVAATAFLPISMCLCTFSITTIASSTSTPITTDMPSRDIRLREKLNSFMPMKEPISESGTTSMTMSASRQLARNIRMTNATRMTAASRSSSTELMDDRVKSEVSETNSSARLSDEYVLSSSLMDLRTASLSSMALASPCL